MDSTISALAQRALTRALSRKGQFAGFLWKRPLKTLKGVSSVITKEVRCVARVGIDYEKQAAVQGMRANGDLPEVNQGLPWGLWLQFPYLIEHEGEIYLRLYPVRTAKPKVIYRMNGQTVRKEEVEALCRASEFRDHGNGNCITLNVSHLQRMR